MSAGPFSISHRRGRAGSRQLRLGRLRPARRRRGSMRSPTSSTWCRDDRLEVGAPIRSARGSASPRTDACMSGICRSLRRAEFISGCRRRCSREFLDGSLARCERPRRIKSPTRSCPRTISDRARRQRNSDGKEAASRGAPNLAAFGASLAGDSRAARSRSGAAAGRGGAGRV